VFEYFRDNKLFHWNDIHNCEDRAEAIAILLTEWKIPHSKAWVFSGYYLRKDWGSLRNLWNYHVAIMLPVDSGNGPIAYVIDPTHSNELISMEDWAEMITLNAFSYHFVKNSHVYIFPNGLITKHNWHQRDRQNYKWTMQGLSGINGVSTIGKAQVTFNKYQIKRTIAAFNLLKHYSPFPTSFSKPV
jgi:hypothetical protein